MENLMIKEQMKTTWHFYVLNKDNNDNIVHISVHVI